jgi:alginate O-acetyltransferase complex protein AlgI
MIFTTPWFLVFSVAVFGASIASMKWAAGRRWLLLLSSIVFYYHFAGMFSLLIVVTLALIVYFGAIIGSSEQRLRYLLMLALAAPVLALIYFRYTGMVATTVADMVGSPADAGFIWLVAPAFVPLGISFFAFEFCHYLVDVLKGAKPVKNPLHFGIFAFLYPRMAAGPIIRFQNIIPQVEAMPVPGRDDVVFGIRRIAFGFAKKFFIADPVALLITQRYAPEAIAVGVDAVYLCFLLYVRIYMDFSAYSDMAIGLARLWGLRIPENFHFPFVATSPSIFWQRWHISLSTWIRDYIYIPLGGARVSRAQTAVNLLFAMALCGLWHGSAWHFVLWGMFHGVLLISGHFVKQGMDVIAATRLVRRTPDLAYMLDFTRSTVGWVLTQGSVGFSWLLFFYPLSDVARILRALPIHPIFPALI